GGVTRISNTTDLVAGRSVCVGIDGTSPFTGQLDEIDVFNRALSPNEIAAIHQAGSAGKCPPAGCVTPPSGLISWWPAEGNANDVAGGNSGTITTEFPGQVLFSDGKVGKAFDFHGANFVEIPPIPLNSFTLEFWLNQRTRSEDPEVGSFL